LPKRFQEEIMNKALYVLLAPLFFLAGCQTLAQDINKFQSGLQDGLNKLQGGMGVHSNIKDMHGIRFEAKSCEVTEFRTILCRMVVTSKFQDRQLTIYAGKHIKVQDDTGKSYPMRISFGESADDGQTQSLLLADTPYNVTLTAENISSQATKVRAINIGRMDAYNESGKFIGYVKLVLSSPPLPFATTNSTGQAASPAISNQTSIQASGSATGQSVKEFRGVRFDAKSCELTEFRVITCRLVVTSRSQNRQLTIYGGKHTKVQDDTGKSYPTRMSFGESAEGGQKQSVLIADTPYKVTLTAENISRQATKVRAINIGRMDAYNESGKFIGYVKLVLAHPPMIASQGSTYIHTAASSAPATTQSRAPRSSARSAAPHAPTAKTQKPQKSASTSSAKRTATAAWQTVGYWDYDGVDGQYLAQGLVLRNKPGSALG